MLPVARPCWRRGYSGAAMESRARNSRILPHVKPMTGAVPEFIEAVHYRYLSRQFTGAFEPRFQVTQTFRQHAGWAATTFANVRALSVGARRAQAKVGDSQRTRVVRLASR